MKYLTLLLFSIFTSTLCAEKAKLTKDQVKQIAELVLENSTPKVSAEEYELDKMSYNEKEGFWSIPKKQFQVIGSRIHFFEIRDSDGACRRGVIGNMGFEPKKSEKFKITPALRGKLKKILNS